MGYDWHNSEKFRGLRRTHVLGFALKYTSHYITTLFLPKNTLSCAKFGVQGMAKFVCLAVRLCPNHMRT